MLRATPITAVSPMSDIAEATIERGWHDRDVMYAITSKRDSYVWITLRGDSDELTLSKEDLQAMLNALEGCEDD